MGTSSDISIGFPFHFFCGTYTTLRIDVNGRLFFGGSIGACGGA